MSIDLPVSIANPAGDRLRAWSIGQSDFELIRGDHMGPVLVVLARGQDTVDHLLSRLAPQSGVLEDEPEEDHRPKSAPVPVRTMESQSS